MSYDEAFKTLLISSNAKLNLELNHLVIKQDENIAKLFLKDINIIVLESLQVSLSSALFNAFARHKIILLTCDETHSINGVFTPFLGHFQSAKIAKEQMNVSAQKKAILWQKIIKNKILNQAFVLKKHNKIGQSNELINLAKKVSLNDSKNIEAVAAALYFKTLFGVSFSRDELCFENSALNYGYAIIRACIIRAVCISGLLPWLGIKHDNIYNSFASKIAYISSPTLDIDLIKLRAKKILPKALELGIFHVIFITLSSEDSFFEQGVKFEVISFDKFSLGF
ncbi:type II CRISPR-associated endonuclease Cas1 [Campylobacter jejuni]|uniref:type II CRISPR-associated endonuclease Cas1 n=1 Tax=Campylobacter jejuni TaxID=197 RepID=UPI0021ADCEF6|nr:type II CRISPR-associated endonuclease Cas1 [Campylobacter jejuni]